MLNVFKTWIEKYFSDQEAIFLLLILVFGFGIIITMGAVLAPVLASIVIAYLLHSWVRFLRRFNIPKLLSYLMVYLGFLAIFVICFFVLLPLIWEQVVTLFADLPTMLQKSKLLLLELIQKYPAFFSEQQVNSIIANILHDAQGLGKIVFTASIATIPGIITVLVYIILIPMLVFFFLKDDEKISKWCASILPEKKALLKRVWNEVNAQIGNYVKGKVTEIIIVGVVTYIVFLVFDLRYALLLASLVGVSVVIPYVGAIVVTIPVILVAYFQWGFVSTTGYFALLYFIVQALDGNFLVPLLFSEAVNLHPVAIIVAILVFGSFFGFWGIFFAIPLATLVKAVVCAWPKK